MAIDPRDSALDAVAAYFGSIAGIAKAIRGWPEFNESLGLADGPVVSIDFDGAPATREECAPYVVNDAEPFLYRYGWLTIIAQLDLWALYRVQRDEAGAILERALHNQLQFGRSGLYLTQADYHERPLTVTANEVQSVGEPYAAIEGSWRRTWTLTIVTDLVGETTTPALTEAVLRDGDAIEPDFTIP